MTQTKKTHPKLSHHWTMILVIFFVLVGISIGVLFGREIEGQEKVTTNEPQKAEEVPFGEEIMLEIESVDPELEPEDEEEVLPPEKVLFEYIIVTGGCDVHFVGECLNVRSGPGVDFPVVSQLRNGVVLKTSEKVTVDGITWYKILFDEWLRYPERVNGDWYVSADFVEAFWDEGTQILEEKDEEEEEDENPESLPSKEIIIDRSDQKLYAYEDGELFMEVDVSTGLQFTPTPRGNFKVFKKTPSRYMQGPLPYLASDKYYDLPGVPWDLYFTEQGAVIHGAYWHDNFGSPYSHGCVNISPVIARTLYEWTPLGTPVIVRD